MQKIDERHAVHTLVFTVLPSQTWARLKERTSPSLQGRVKQGIRLHGAKQGGYNVLGVHVRLGDKYTETPLVRTLLTFTVCFGVTRMSVTLSLLWCVCVLSIRILL